MWGRLRRRLARFHMDLIERVRVERALEVLPALASSIPARVRAAVIRSWWNGWATSRRFQNRAGLCIFGCQHEDSLEHYAHCGTVREFGCRSLALAPSPPEMAMADFLVLIPRYSAEHKELLSKKAHRVAAVYLVHCRARHSASRSAPLTWHCLDHMLKELRRGS